MNRRAAVVTAFVAIPLIALNEATRQAKEPPRFRLIPVEDSAAFARCKAEDGFIEMTQERDAPYDAPFTRALWCEERR